MMGWVKTRWALVKGQISTKIGGVIAGLAAAWPAMQQFAPGAVTQLSQTNTVAANVVNVSFVVIGFGLMAWNENTKGTK